MSFTTTLTSKYQFTLPKSVRDKLGVKRGVKFDIFPTLEGGFVGKPKTQLNILKYAGDLAHLDDGKAWKTIREEAEKKMVKDWVSSKT